MKQSSRTRTAFTLMEVLLVLAILLVIMGLVVPKILGRQKSANVDATMISITLAILHHQPMVSKC